MSSHAKYVCKHCYNVTTQCRCIGPHELRWDDPCTACSAVLRDGVKLHDFSADHKGPIPEHVEWVGSNKPSKLNVETFVTGVAELVKRVGGRPPVERGRKPDVDDVNAFKEVFKVSATKIDPGQSMDWSDLAYGFLLGRGVGYTFIDRELVDAMSCGSWGTCRALVVKISDPHYQGTE